MLENTKNKFNSLLKRTYDFYIAYGLMTFAVVMIGAFIFGLVLRERKIKEFKDGIDESAERISQTFKETLTSKIDNLDKLSLWFVQIGNPELNFRIDRNQASTILSENISSEADMKSLFMVWEPNMFDGKDSVFAETEYHDSTGRFLPLFVKHSDGIVERDYVKNYNDSRDVNSYYYYKTKKKRNDS